MSFESQIEDEWLSKTKIAPNILCVKYTYLESLKNCESATKIFFSG